eukprot:scaffold203662_cov14-Tisochrysis_lutea.AAC.1
MITAAKVTALKITAAKCIPGMTIAAMITAAKVTVQSMTCGTCCMLNLPPKATFDAARLKAFLALLPKTQGEAAALVFQVGT